MGKIQKVTDPAKRVNDAYLAKVLAKQGIDKDYVELWHDYAPRSKGKEYSPYARFYKDRKSNKMVMVVSILPHVDTLGHKLDCRWILSRGKYYSGINLFSAIVEGSQVKLTTLSDQPTGAKKNDWVKWEPQLFLNGIEQLHTGATLLATDPINAGYHDNTLEWDYGICKRRIRIFEGRLRERWIFTSNPNGEVRIKHNQTGNFKLKFGEYKINDDEELVPAEVFNQAEYPLEVGATATYYPDPDVENTSVDGWVGIDSTTSTWQSIVGLAGTGFNDTNDRDNIMLIKSSATTDRWQELRRGFLLFDTSGLPDNAEIGVVTLSINGGLYKADDLSITPDANIYSSSPFSNTALQADDFGDVGTTPFSTPISYANWVTDSYNDFVLNDAGKAVDTQLNRQGVSKYSLRNANYDVAEELDPGNHAPNWSSSAESRIQAYFAEQGNDTDKDPKLVVTYTSPIVVTPGTLSLTITEYAPVLKETLTPSTLSLTITAYAPSVSIGTLVTPTTLSLTLTEYAPTIITPVTVTPGTLSLTLTGYAPILKEVVTPPTLNLSLTSYAPVLKETVTPGTLSLTISSYAPILKEVITPSTLSLVLSGYAPILKEVVTPTTLSLITIGYAPAITYGWILSIDSSVFSTGLEITSTFSTGLTIKSEFKGG